VPFGDGVAGSSGGGGGEGGGGAQLEAVMEVRAWGGAVCGAPGTGQAASARCRARTQPACVLDLGRASKAGGGTRPPG
jgi:hypothetical protein